MDRIGHERRFSNGWISKSASSSRPIRLDHRQILQQDGERCASTRSAAGPSSPNESIADWVARLRRVPARPAQPARPLRTAGSVMTALRQGRLRAPPAARESLRGPSAGFASRFAAFAVNLVVFTAIFLLVLAAIDTAASVLTRNSVHFSRANTWVVIGICSVGVHPTLASFLRPKRKDPRWRSVRRESLDERR